MTRGTPTSSCAGWRPSRRCRARASAPPCSEPVSIERTTGAPTRVWARARCTALAFYVANGFDVVGDEFVDGTTGLPHRIVVVDVPTSAFHRPR